jgi:cytoskeletal protein RodZ
MKEFFDNLKSKRIEKGIDLRQISQKTKLNLNILAAIENGELEQIPKGYRRIYLRRYIREIGLDVDEVMKDYDMLVGDTDVEKIAEHENLRVDIKKGRFANPFARERMKIIYTILGSVSIIGLIILGILGLKSLMKAEPHFEVKEISVPVDDQLKNIIASVDSLDHPFLTKEREKKLKERPDNRIIVYAKERCWIKQIIDFKDTVEYILPKGKSRTFPFKEQIRFIIGRGDAVKIQVNDKVFDHLAPKGVIISRLVVDKFGIVSKILRKPKPKVEENDSTARSRPDSTNGG